MILVDANLLLYAEDSLSEHHDGARTWWDERVERQGINRIVLAGLERFHPH